ncbi:uncharacterized protein [Misgurnus anguillicaudatus]|uniref:uncharacterized protein n=1 Tax=Misgurnus anguillicaudatus TaxID=75329 RepID=UPI003CCF1BA8
MHIISSCIILFMMILNILCEKNKEWNISFTPAEVTAVAGLCVVIPCTFTNPNEAKPENLQLYQCTDGTQCAEVTENTKVMKFETGKNKCNININNIKAGDEGEYATRVEGDPSHTYRPRFKIIIQDKPVINNPPLKEGEQANLSCSAPAPCPETPPEITWRINLNKKNIKLKEITFTTSQGFYVATLTFMPTADLHNATVECEARCGNTIISTNKTIEVKLNELKTNPTANTIAKVTAEHRDQTMNPTESQNATGNNKGVSNLEDFFQSLGLSRVHTFLVGIAISAVFFSVVLCCWVSCNRTKKPEVLAVPPDSAVHLEAGLRHLTDCFLYFLIKKHNEACTISCVDVVQTNIDSAVNGEQTNEETPLQNQFDVEMSSTQVEMTGPAEENEAGGADPNVDYAAIDYSLLKKKPEEEDEETANTDYAEIKRDTKGRTTPQNQDEQVEISNEGSENQKQNEGEEGLYSNSQELESLAEYPKFP